MLSVNLICIHFSAVYKVSILLVISSQCVELIGNRGTTQGLCCNGYMGQRKRTPLKCTWNKLCSPGRNFVHGNQLGLLLSSVCYLLFYCVVIKLCVMLCHEASWVAVFLCSGFSVSFQLLWNLFTLCRLIHKSKRASVPHIHLMVLPFLSFVLVVPQSKSF